MAWPDDGSDLPAEVLVAWGADLTADPDTWVWTNLSGRWYRNQPVRLRDGRSDGAREGSPSSLSGLMLGNDDGALTPESPMSPNWPNVIQNTPTWLRLDPTAMGLPPIPGTYWDLHTGFADQWEPVFVPDSDGTVASYVVLTSSGILRRLSQGARPLASALRRAILAAEPVAYWPCEDGSDSTSAASALGAAPHVPTGAVGPVAPDFAGAEGPAGSDALPDVTSHGVLVGPVPAYTHAGEWQVEVWFKTDTGESLDYTASVPLQWDTPGGTIVAWDALLFVGRGAGNPGLGAISLDIGGYSAPIGGGEPTESDREVDMSIVTGSLPSVQGSWHQLRVCAQQSSPGTITLTAYLNGTLIGSVSDSTWTLGPVTRVTANPLQGHGAYAGVDGVGLAGVGQIAVYDTIADPGTYQPGLGYPGEAAATRVARLCGEEGVPCTVDAGESEAMGPQRPGTTLLELLRECERADMGILSERRWGLHYRPRVTRYNQQPAFTVDLTTIQHTGDPAAVLQPKFDDQLTRNEWAASRPGGAKDVTAADVGDQARRGRYDDAVAVNVATDGRLLDQAGWRVNLGVQSMRRYPGWPLDLAGNPQYLVAWMATELGDWVRRSAPPAPHPPGHIDTLVEGWSATVSPRGWQVSISGGPYRPWQVATADGDRRVAADGSTLAATATATATSLLLFSTDTNGPWTTGNTVTNTDDFPLFASLNGEMIQASGIATTLNDTFSRTVSNGWGSASTGQAWTVTGMASEYGVVGGTTGRMALVNVNDLHVAHLDAGATDITLQATATVGVVPTGAGISPRLVVRWVDSNNYYEAVLLISTGGATTLSLNKRVAGVGSVVVSPVSVGTHSAGNMWTIRVSIVGPRMAAKAWRVGDLEPSYQLFGLDTSLSAGTRVGAMARRETGNTNGSQNVDWDNFGSPTLQTVTVSARSVNGVVRAHAAGVPVDVWDPAIAPL